MQKECEQCKFEYECFDCLYFEVKKHNEKELKEYLGESVTDIVSLMKKRKEN